MRRSKDQIAGEAEDFQMEILTGGWHVAVGKIMNSIKGEQLLAQLNWRYATKQFDPARKISPEDWAVLENALILSPSSYGLQGVDRDKAYSSLRLRIFHRARNSLISSAS